ncbi:MAG: hypothetical protein ACNA8W_09580 [Bradymonadaceae bacterium]
MVNWKRVYQKLTLGFILLAWTGLSACAGCGEDDPDPETTPDVGFDAGEPDAGEPDAGEPDAGEPDAADIPDATPPPPGYDPTLEDLGEPSAQCDIAIIEPNVANPQPMARIFVPSFRLDMEDALSHGVFRGRVHRFVFDHVLPCVSEDYPNVVVFPESMVLPMLVLGDKAAQTRTRTTIEQAISTMLPSLTDPFGYYARKYSDDGLETVTFILLAVTDQIVRATYDTFGQIADRYDLYVSVTVDLPEFERVTDPELVAILGDPDLEGLDYAYEATSPEVKNVQLLFGPDGELFDQTEKTYVTLTELGLLALTPGDFTKEHPMQTPWGRTGIVISKPAWMPDVQERLDDMGTQVIFQPEAYSGGWIIEAGHPDRWEPDSFNLGGWLMAQRGGRAVYNLVPQLTGNFYEMIIDSQVQLIEKTTRDGGAAEFVGQRGPLAGNTFIAPWVMDDPIMAYPTMSLEERRSLLREAGQRLLPGSGDSIEGQYVEGMWAIDLQLYEDDGIEESMRTHPDAVTVDSTVFVASSAGAVGSRFLEIQSYDAATLATGDAHEHHVEGFDLIRPSLVADGDGNLHLVAELLGDGENRLYYVSFDPALETFSGGTILDSAGDWAFRPSLARVESSLYLSYIQRIGNGNRASFLRGNLGNEAPFADVEPVEIEPRPMGRPELRANQWDARVSATESAIVVTWIDFKTWQWEVLAAASIDQGLTWSAPVRLDDVESGVEAINANPTVATIDEDSQFIVAWTSVAATRPNSGIATRRLIVGEEGGLTLEAVEHVDHGTAFDDWSWRPAIFVSAMSRIDVVYEHLSDGARSLHNARWTSDDGWQHMAVQDDAEGARQFVTLTAAADGYTAVFEDARPFQSTTGLVVTPSP